MKPSASLKGFSRRAFSLGSNGGYVLSNRLIHGGSVHEANETLIVKTAAEQWTYAVEFPLFSDLYDRGIR
jgi:hypothetical protein